MKSFTGWSDGNGLLADDGAGSRLFRATYGPLTAEWRQGGTFGFVLSGQAVVGRRTMFAGEYFQTPRMPEDLSVFGVVMLVQRLGYFGVSLAGGPLEPLGRLRYIDGCSDTLLLPPQVKGEPCLNFLHFPPGINQTQHTHPSTRFGCVVSGSGYCRTPDGETRLTPGLIFWIPTDGLHSFRTESEHMDVVAYHPDSDFGPEHQTHPMVNRTLVDGGKIDNTDARHANAEIIKGWIE